MITVYFISQVFILKNQYKSILINVEPILDTLSSTGYIRVLHNITEVYYMFFFYVKFFISVCIHVPVRMSRTNLGDPFTFYTAASTPKLWSMTKY